MKQWEFTDTCTQATVTIQGETLKNTINHLSVENLLLQFGYDPDLLGIVEWGLKTKQNPNRIILEVLFEVDKNTKTAIFETLGEPEDIFGILSC